MSRIHSAGQQSRICRPAAVGCRRLPPRCRRLPSAAVANPSRLHLLSRRSLLASAVSRRPFFAGRRSTFVMVLSGARFCLLVMLTTVRSFLLAGAVLLRILLDGADAFRRRAPLFCWQARYFPAFSYWRRTACARFSLAGAALSPPPIW